MPTISHGGQLQAVSAETGEANRRPGDVRLLAAESQQADIVAHPLAREFLQIAFEQF
jgi:hypothetical protein